MVLPRRSANRVIVTETAQRPAYVASTALCRVYHQHGGASCQLSPIMAPRFHAKYENNHGCSCKDLEGMRDYSNR